LTRRGGRPRIVGPEHVRLIANLRGSKLSWKEIGLRLGLKPETCRRALWAVKKSGRAVGNPPDGVNNPAGEV
jgi:hypothetical protein